MTDPGPVFVDILSTWMGLLLFTQHWICSVHPLYIMKKKTMSTNVKELNPAAHI